MTVIDNPRAIRVKTATGWADLVIQGPPGDDGAQGPQGIQGPQGNVGEQGPTGAGVPAGGVAGQSLIKNSGINYDTVWGAAAGGGVDYIGNYSAATPYKKGDVVRYNGQDYLAVNDSTGVTPPGAAVVPLGVVNIGLTLPTSPYDGQEAILVDSLTVPTYSWRFRYVASITDAYKWVFIGGSPLRSYAGGGQTPTGTIGSWVPFNDNAPVVTVPRNGLYLGTISARVLNATAQSYVGIRKEGWDPVVHQAMYANGPGNLSSAQVNESLECTGNHILRMNVYLGSPPGNFDQRILSVTPVRVS